MLKRYEDHELGESASRRVSYHATADYAKSSRARCRQCNRNIEQKELRLALMLQDDEGYKSTAWMHFDCFLKHPETKKLTGADEIHGFAKLTADDRARISAEFDTLRANRPTTTRKRRSKQKDNDDDDDDDDDDEFSPEAKPSTTKRPRRAGTSAK